MRDLPGDLENIVNLRLKLGGERRSEVVEGHWATLGLLFLINNKLKAEGGAVAFIKRAIGRLVYEVRS